MILRFLASIVKYVVRLFLPCKVYGNPKREKKACLYLGNHISGYDTVMFYLWTKGEMPCVLYKAELAKVFPLPIIFHSFRSIPVKRGDADVTSVKITLERLSKGHNVLITPEGHRNAAHNCLLPFKKGAALYALKSKAPIRLFYIWEKTKTFRKNYMIMGDEFTLDQFYDKPITKKLLQEVTDYLQAKMDELRVELNGILAAKGKKHRKYTQKELKRIYAEYGDRAEEVIANTFVLDAPVQTNGVVEPTADVSTQAVQVSQDVPSIYQQVTDQQ